MICMKDYDEYQDKKVSISTSGNFVYTKYSIQMNYYKDDYIWMGMYLTKVNYYNLKYLGAYS